MSHTRARWILFSVSFAAIVSLMTTAAFAQLEMVDFADSLQTAIASSDIQTESTASQNISLVGDHPLADIQQTPSLAQAASATATPGGINLITGDNASVFAAWVQLLNASAPGTTITNLGNWNSDTLTLAGKGVENDLVGIDAGIATVNPGNFNVNVFFDNTTQTYAFGSPTAHPNGGGADQPLTIVGVAPADATVQINSP